MNDLKQMAVDFLELTASGRAPEAFERYAAPQFRHHNPYFKGDAASLCAAMQDNAAQFPDKRLTVQRALEDGPLVAVHSRVDLGRGSPDVALAHIFRFEAGRIVELWDIGAPGPESSPNEHGMF